MRKEQAIAAQKKAKKQALVANITASLSAVLLIYSVWSYNEASATLNKLQEEKTAREIQQREKEMLQLREQIQHCDGFLDGCYCDPAQEASTLMDSTARQHEMIRAAMDALRRRIADCKPGKTTY